MKTTIHPTAFTFLVTACALICSSKVFAATEYRDTLDKAVAGPDEMDVVPGDVFTPYVADALSYDSNLFRLPGNVTNLTTLTGLGPKSTREDYMNSASAGLDAQWLAGSRQRINLDLRVDDNRFQHNDDLNNISTNDQVIWNWGVGGVISGQVGADYSRFLASFVNTAIYSRDLIQKEEYFAAARYQVGPRWAFFGGLLDSKYTLSNAQTKSNNSESKSVDLGAEYATSAANTIGFDYRFTDARYPNGIVLNGVSFDPDYREDRARVLAKYVISDKTILDASAGYLKRDYPNTVIGSFAGDIWRLSVQWQPTLKTQLEVAGWRQLAADLTAQSDYFVDKGGSISPTWNASEKVTLSISVSRDDRDYIGSNPGALVAQARRDAITGELANLRYIPTSAIICNFSFGHEKRSSNLQQFTYNDNKGEAGITFKF
jgi:exopolysaccharide biosynthesis operon protein EpsL